MLILIDQDGVLADFDRAAMDEYTRRFPGPSPFPSDRKQFYLADSIPRELRSRVESIYNEPGFFQRLPLITGAGEALAEMIRRNIDFVICTSPVLGNPTCLQDKYNWLVEHFGSRVARRVIFTKDKTLVRGDILIEDRPDVTGEYPRSWEHVVFDASYNRHVTGRRRLTWANWQEVLVL